MDDKPFLLEQGVVEIENFIRKDQLPLLPFYSFLLLTTLVLFSTLSISIIVSMYRSDEISSPVDDKNECHVKRVKI